MATIQSQGVPSTDAGKDAKAAMESTRVRDEETAKAILREAVERAQVLVAGGAEVGDGLSRADAVRAAANRVLDRLYPEFAVADHAGWDRAVDDARKRIPDALKQVGHSGDPEDHPVCKAFLRALRPSKKGSELRAAFIAPPYGWPEKAIEGGDAGTGQCRPGQGDGAGRKAGGCRRPERDAAAQLYLCSGEPRPIGRASGSLSARWAEPWAFRRSRQVRRTIIC